MTTPVDIWSCVDRLVDRAPSTDDLRAHGLHLLAARSWRARGRPLPADLVLGERAASFSALAAPAVLAEVRAAYDGPIILLKGPELATRYPDPALRPYGDLDLLVGDVEAARATLISAGFVPAGPPPRADYHHLQGLQSPRFPLRVELHSRPSWIAGAAPPPVEELFELAQPSAVGVDGILAPPSTQHALLVAAHAWTHEPLGRILDLIDIALVTSECESGETATLAARWGAGRLWRTSMAMVDAVLFGQHVRPALLQVPARKLTRVQERSVLESHLYRAVAPYVVLPHAAAARTSGLALARVLRPRPGETWLDRARRARVTTRHMLMRRTEHERAIGYRP